MRIIALTLALACVAPTAAVALPSGGLSTSSATIAHRDLNLDAAEGRATLHRRVRAAIRQVCGAPASHDLASETLRIRCTREANEQARRQVNELG